MATTYLCIDCPADPMDRGEARWHAHHEGHCVVEEEDEQ